MFVMSPEIVQLFCIMKRNCANVQRNEQKQHMSVNCSRSLLRILQSLKNESIDVWEKIMIGVLNYHIRLKYDVFIFICSNISEQSEKCARISQNFCTKLPDCRKMYPNLFTGNRLGLECDCLVRLRGEEQELVVLVRRLHFLLIRTHEPVPWLVWNPSHFLHENYLV